MVEEMVEEITSQGFTDYHCHLLPSIDDGPSTFDGSLKIAKTLNKLGFNKIYCTPHLIRGIYDTTSDRVSNAVMILQDKLMSEGIDLTLHAGIEYRLDEHLPDFLSDPVTLSDNMILCEPPTQINPDFLLDCVYQINRKGLRPLIAHPERNAIILGNKRLINRLKEMDCLFQGNIKSFVGSYGTSVKKRALDLLRNDLYFCIGTDAHSPIDLEEDLNKGLIKIKNTSPHFYHELLKKYKATGISRL
jgi:protein-tyrosine phosphatase